jgi:hypothetical protein
VLDGLRAGAGAETAGVGQERVGEPEGDFLALVEVAALVAEGLVEQIVAAGGPRNCAAGAESVAAALVVRVAEAAELRR